MSRIPTPDSIADAPEKSRPLLENGTYHQDLGADHFDRRSNEVKARHS